MQKFYYEREGYVYKKAKEQKIVKLSKPSPDRRPH